MRGDKHIAKQAISVRLFEIKGTSQCVSLSHDCCVLFPELRGCDCLPYVQVSKLSSVKREAAAQLLAQYGRVLTHLRCAGALLGGVRPEMLLDEDDLERVLEARDAAAASEADADAVEAWYMWKVGGTGAGWGWGWGQVHSVAAQDACG